MPITRASLTIVALGLAVLAGGARANSPDALMAALDRLDTEVPTRASLHAELWRAEGLGDERETFTNNTDMTLFHGPDGLALQYNPDLLRRLDGEAETLTTDPDASSPVNDFIWRLHLSGLRPLLFPARSLRRTVERAQFRDSAPDEYNGETATRLMFDRDRSVVHERVRRYLKEFESTLEIWVRDDGTPLASRIKLDAKGSILFVIRGEHHEERISHYTVERGRLLVRQHEEWQKTDLPGEHHESRLNHQLSVEPSPCSPQPTC